jgi:hypothetical protein
MKPIFTLFAAQAEKAQTSAAMTNSVFFIPPP